MSTETLQELLEGLADGIERPREGQTAARAWTRARQVRRRRGVLGAAAALLLVAMPLGLVQLTDAQPVRPWPSAAAPNRSVAPDGVYVDRLPTSLVMVTPLGWPTSLDPPADAPALADAPMAHSVLVFQPGIGRPLYFYGTPALSSDSNARQWARLDAPQGVAGPLRVNSLGHAGLVALPELDEYVVIDPAAVAIHHVPLPGDNEDVVWLPSGENLLVLAGPTATVGTADAVIGPLSLDVPEGVVAVAGYAPGAVTLSDWTPVTVSGCCGSPTLVRRADLQGRTLDEFVVAGPDGYPLETILGRPWQMGSRIAQTFVQSPLGQDWRVVVLVMDEQARAVTHVLDLGQSDVRGSVLGWLGTETLLVDGGTLGVLAWHLDNGSVTVALPPAEGSLSISPYDGWSRVYR